MSSVPTRVFISYSHDTEKHMDTVLALADRLRLHGLDCWIDQYEWFPSEGWPQWCENQIEQARFVLVACTRTYLRRFKGKEDGGRGKGVTFEGHIITQELYNAQGKNNKFIPIVFRAGDRRFIPILLQGASNFNVSTTNDYNKLRSGILGKSKVPPPIGAAHSAATAPPRALRKLNAKRDFTPRTRIDGTHPTHEKQIRLLHSVKTVLEKKVWIEYQRKILDRWFDLGEKE